MDFIYTRRKVLIQKNNKSIRSDVPKFMIVENINYLPNAHREMEVTIVLEGTIIVTIEGVTEICLPGSVILVDSFDIHSYHSEGPTVILGCIFRKEFSHEIESLIGRLGSVSIVSTPKIHHELILEYAKWIWKTKDFSTNSQKISHVLHVLGYLEGDKVKKIDKNITSPIVVNALQYLDENVGINLTLDKISFDLGVAKYYLSHIFKSQVGIPIIQYFIKLKLALAKRLLIETELNISEISDSIGFGSVRTFNRLFISNFSLTPSEFRSKQRNKDSLEINLMI